MTRYGKTTLVYYQKSSFKVTYEWNKSLIFAIVFAASNTCPSDYPFAYLNGAYCCRTNRERTDKDGNPDGYPNEITSGTCDGIGFTRESRCCEKNAYFKCPDVNGCSDYPGMRKFNQFTIFSIFLHKKVKT